MSGALLGAVSCGRCGLPDAAGPSCPRCGAAWVEASTGAVALTEPGPLLGVVRAGAASRAAAFLVDLAAVGALLAVGLLVGRGPAVDGLVLGAVGLLVLVQAALLLARGRTLGRLLLGQRTVDDLTGQPVRLRRLWHQVVGAAGWRWRLIADLRRGRDPGEPLFSPAVPHAVRGGASTTPVQPWTRTGPDHPAAATGAPAPSVGIVLANGERYEIFASLLLGRSPSDPGGPSGRALLAWPDLSRRLAKTHALLEWSGSVLWVTDLHTVTGTTLVSPYGQRRPLAPGVRAPAAIGSALECGGRLVQVVPGG